MDLFNEAVERLNERKRQHLNAQRPLAPPQKRLRWFVPSEEPAEFTVRSPLDYWYSHWDVPQRRSRRCGGPECLSCQLGSPVAIRFVLAVEGAEGLLWLLELRERHQELLESLREAPSGQIGARIRVFRAWKAKNAPIQIELIGRQEVVPIEISRVVRSLGLEAQRSLKPGSKRVD